MHLCIVTHSFAKGSGQGRVNYEVVQQALLQGYRLTLVGSDIDSEVAQHPQVSWVPIRVSGWPTELLKNIIFSAKATRWLQRHRDHFDLLKINGAIAASAADVNAVHFVHSAWLRSPAHTFRVRRDLYGLYQWLYTAVNAQWERQAFQRAETVVAVSQKIAEELVGIGVPSQKIKVILNGVDPEEFSPGPISRSALDLPEDVPLAFFAGDIQTSRKNLDTILQALAHVPNLHLAIAGRIDNSPYPQMAADLGIANRAHFLDYRRDIADLMKAVDFFVFPSRYEACTLVLLEAMASGLPVITAATAGGAELVSRESGIVLSDPNDVSALSQAMAALTEHQAGRSQMGEAARAIAVAHSWSHMAKTYLDQLNVS
ncbi:MAG: glycosyltransferase family 4 protein [Cyanobacteria bacterium P01_A01_bin.135]